jgi:predicted SAM-dependent methyltransferase
MGWCNIDVVRQSTADIVAPAWELPFDDESVDVIESRHMFEHLTPYQAGQSLGEWRRVLRVGGRLAIECPDVLKSAEMVLDKSRRLEGLVGIYGLPTHPYQPFQSHRWGWTPTSLYELLSKFGFEVKEFDEPRQTWRPATRMGRDMRVVASRV